MKRALIYLNSVLSVLALLLAMHLWVAMTDSPGADRLNIAQPAAAQGVPNAGQQRREMIDLLKQSNQQIEQLRTLLTSGDVRVRVEAGAADEQPQP